MTGKGRPLLEEVRFKDPAGKKCKEDLVKLLKPVTSALADANEKIPDTLWVTAAIDPAVRQERTRFMYMCIEEGWSTEAIYSTSRINDEGWTRKGINLHTKYKCNLEGLISATMQQWN